MRIPGKISQSEFGRICSQIKVNDGISIKRSNRGYEVACRIDSEPKVMYNSSMI